MGFVQEWLLPGPPAQSEPGGTLLGVWEQVGMLHPGSGAVVPWPEGSLNASVREFFAFFEDGTFRFARFIAGTEVRFDSASREFVGNEEPVGALSGRWQLAGNVLTEEFTDEAGGRRTQPVRLGGIRGDQFTIEEDTPVPGFVLRVVYRRFG